MGISKSYCEREFSYHHIGSIQIDINKIDSIQIIFLLESHKNLNIKNSKNNHMKLSLEQREKNQQMLNSLHQECWKNENFKQQLIQNPKAILENFIGETIKLEDNVKSIIVSDQTDSNIVYLNIPAKVDLENIELSEDELEMISGGCAGFCIAAIIVGSIALYKMVTK